MSMTSEPSEPYELSSDLGAPPPPASSMRGPLDSSGRPTGTEFQQNLMDAVCGSEFHEGFEFGVPIRRRGEALHISYDQALEYLGMNGEN